MRLRRTLVACTVATACLTPKGAAPPSSPGAQTAPPASADPASIPVVHMGRASLDCVISSKEPGHQKLVLVSGGGVEFDAKVTPIVDGTVAIRRDASGAAGTGAAAGMAYHFTSHLVESARASVSGLGPVTLESLDTVVSVAVHGYLQPGGPGTPITFTAGQVDDKGAYIEFRGVVRETQTARRYAFRTTLGDSPEASGRVEPVDSGFDTRMLAKAVVVPRALSTTLVQPLQTATTLAPLP